MYAGIEEGIIEKSGKNVCCAVFGVCVVKNDKGRKVSVIVLRKQCQRRLRTASIYDSASKMIEGLG